MCGKLQLTISHIHSGIGYVIILKGSKFCGLHGDCYPQILNEDTCNKIMNVLSRPSTD